MIFPAITAEISGSEGIDYNKDDVRMPLFFLFLVQSLTPEEGEYYGIGIKCNQIQEGFS
jgi:hypothetical protein